MPGYTNDKNEILRRLRHIEGQVRGLERMVEGGDEAQTKVTEASRAIARLVRS